MPNHIDLDRRSLALHRLVARKLRDDPTGFERVRATLKRWRGQVCAATLPYVTEWEQFAEQGLEACLQVATEDSERGAALRQNSPFAGVLGDAERLAFLRDWRSANAAA